MPLSCAAYNCSNRSGTRSDFSGHFHSFPKDDPLRAKWLVAVQIGADKLELITGYNKPTRVLIPDNS